MSDEANRKRIGLSLTPAYLEALKQLVEKGLYMEPQDAIRDAMRHLFQFHGIESFSEKDLDEKVQE